MQYYTEKEIELAKKYVLGEYTDVQFNYLIFDKKLDKNRMYELADNIKNGNPVSFIVKMMLIYMLFNLIICFIYSFADYLYKY